MTATRAETIERQYERLRQQAIDTAMRGELRAALALYDRSLELAREIGEQERIDVAFCNLSSVAIALGDYREVVAPLREVLMRRSSDAAAFLAADGLSRIHERTKNFKKGLFYARTARHHATAADNVEWLVSSYNQSGNCLLGESYFAEAAAEYQAALDLLPAKPSLTRAGIMVNLGYSQCVLGNTSDALRLAFRSLRWLRRLAAPDFELFAWTYLDLCYAYLEIGRIDRARKHGLRALSRAVAGGLPVVRRNALFLLGETARASGDTTTAYSYFHQLQEFYPDTPNVAATMLAYDMRKLVNLRA